MRRPRRSVAVICSAALAGAGQAAPVAKLSDADDARLAMRIYLGCLVDDAGKGRRHAKLVGFLSQSTESPAGNKAAARLATPDCLTRAATAGTYIAQLRFQPSLLRGEAFRALYLAHAAKPDQATVRPEEIAAGWSTAAGEPATVLRRFGDCTVAVDRVRADAAIRADVASPAETAAYRALGPAMGRCIAPGSSLRFSRAVLEGALSEGLYRQAMKAVPIVAAKDMN